MQYSGAELIARTAATAGLPHQFLTNVQNFQSEATLWVVMVPMSGFFEHHPKLNAAVFEASSTWLSFLPDECDKAYKLYRNERELPPLERLPSETFFEHCVTSFEGGEAPPSRLPEFYGDILTWSSDVYHHDGDDAWCAIETMRGCGLAESSQRNFLGDNARAPYRIDAPTTFIRERVTEIERPDWWPSEDEIRRALEPEAALVRRRRPPRERTGTGKESGMTPHKAFAVFDAEERMIQKLPHDFADKIVWGSRYPHHDTTSAWDAIATLTEAGVEAPLIARMMGKNAAAQFGIELTQHGEVAG